MHSSFEPHLDVASRLVRVDALPMAPVSTPAATYRLQFNAAFTFADATAIVGYLHALGISHAYASSYFKAVPGSTHGYDVADPTQLNPEIGDARSYGAWSRRCTRSGMGHIIDLVPNHMGIAQVGEPVVAGRARERPQLAVRARVRHRLASAEAGAREQGAAADPRRLATARSSSSRRCDSSTTTERSACATTIRCCRSRRAPTIGFWARALIFCSRRSAARATPASSSSASSPPSGTCPAARRRTRNCSPNATARRK